MAVFLVLYVVWVYGVGVLCVWWYAAGLFPLGDGSELHGALLTSISTSLGCLPLRWPMPMPA